MNNPEDIRFLGGILLGGLALWAILKYQGLAFIYDICLTDQGIRFVLFSVVRVGFMSFSNIESVEEVSGGYSSLCVYNFKNRFWHATFLVRKKKGIFSKQVLITPPDADDFTRALTHAGISVSRQHSHH